MKYAALSLLICLTLLSGCAGDSPGNTVSTTTASQGAVAASTPAPAPTPTPVAVSDLNASAVATDGISGAAVQAIVPVVAPGVSAKNLHYLPTIDPTNPSSTALSAALDVALTGGGYVKGPLGGSILSVQDGGRIRAQFTIMKTLQGTLNGELDVTVTSGSPASGNFDAAVSLVGFTVDGPDGTRSFSGPARLSVSTVGQTTRVAWTADFAVSLTDSSITYRHMSAVQDITLSGNSVTCEESLNGAMLVTAMHGVTGTITVSTSTPLRFSGTLSNNAAPLTITAGALSFNDAQMTVTVVKPDAASVAVAGKVVKVVPWGYLGGPQQAVFALRPAIADTIFDGGTVITVDSGFTKGQALAVLDGRVLAVGSSTSVNAFRGTATTLVALGGKTVMPGFIEPHAHVNQTALTLMANVTPLVVPCGTEALGYTIEDALAALAAALVKVPNAPALYGFNFDPSRLVASERMQNLTLQQLDQISPTIPIVVQNASQHISYANSAAFRATGIWPTAPKGPYTPPPPSSPLAGFIPTDPQTGLPIGQLNEFAQVPFLQVALAGITETPQGKVQFLAQWREFMNVLAAQGVTTVSDMLTGAALGITGETDVFSGLALDPTNPVRLRGYFDSSSNPDPAKLPFFPGEGYARLRYNGAKFVADGSTQGLTAGLNFDYIFPGPFPVSPRGLMDFTSDLAQYQVELPWHAAGWQLAVHSNGDHAIERTSAVFAMLQQTNPRSDPRFRLEHFTVHQPSELAGHVALAQQLKLEIGQTIGHVYFWGEVLSDTLLGGTVSQNIDPMKSLFDAGVRVSTHSDSPVTTCKPLRNIGISVARVWQDLPQQVLGASERVTVDQAIRTVTVNPAHALFMDTEYGSLEVGKQADLVILGQDPTQTAPQDIPNIPVVSTWLSGRRVSGAAP